MVTGLWKSAIQASGVPEVYWTTKVLYPFQLEMTRLIYAQSLVFQNFTKSQFGLRKS